MTNDSAYATVHRATKDGRLDKPDTCQVCGINCEHHRIEAHHHNGHDEPLNVWWLCSQCNGRLKGNKWHSGDSSLDDTQAWLKDNYKSAHGHCIECNRQTSPFYQGDVMVRYLG